MDILIHALSGIAAGTVVSNFQNKGIMNKSLIIGFSGLGSVIPDFDVISLWSGFDNTLGKLFGLNNSGKEIYFSKLWYSHHGFFHSIIAGLFFALCILFFLYFIKNRLRKNDNESIITSFRNNSLIFIGFTAGYIIHLFEDMPTPACNWGGVRLFWPLKSYVGGTGEIWWWNNYDIFIITLSVILLNVLILGVSWFVKINIRKINTIIFLAGFAFAVIQIKNRDYSFNYVRQTERFQEYELKSKEIQREILGNNVYKLMVDFDNKLGINF